MRVLIMHIQIDYTSKAVESIRYISTQMIVIQRPNKAQEIMQASVSTDDNSQHFQLCREGEPTTYMSVICVKVPREVGMLPEN